MQRTIKKRKEWKNKEVKTIKNSENRSNMENGGPTNEILCKSKALLNIASNQIEEICEVSAKGGLRDDT